MSYNENVFRLADICNLLNNCRVEQIEPQIAELQKKSARSEAEEVKLQHLQQEWQATTTLSHFAYRVRQTAQSKLGYEVKWLSVKEIHEVGYDPFLIQMGHDSADVISVEELEQELARIKTSRWAPLLSVKTQGNDKLYRINVLMQPEG